MTADRYMLPLPLRDQKDDELSAETIFANCRRRYSTTSQVSSGAGSVSARVASPPMSLSSMRTSSRVSNGGPPPTSFRFPKPPTTLDHSSTSSQRGGDSQSACSSPPPAAPFITKRRSSLALNGMAKTTRSTSQSMSSHGSGVYYNSRNAIPSTPISTTPSLTFSHSRTTSRSDSPGFPSMGSLQQYCPRLESDAEEAWHYNSQPRVRSVASVGRLRASSYSTMAKGKWKCQDEQGLRENPCPEDSFLPGSFDGRVVSEEIRPFARTTAISFQQKPPRNPDKVAHLLGEEYQQLQRNAVRGRLDANSTLSLSSASKPGFKSIFSTMKIKLKKEDEPVSFEPVHGMEEDLFRFGHVIGRKTDSQVHIISKERQAPDVRALFPESEDDIDQIDHESQCEEDERRDVFPRGGIRQRSTSATLERQADTLLHRGTFESTQRRLRLPLASSTHHNEEDVRAKSFLRFDGDESGDESRSDASLDSPKSSKQSGGHYAGTTADTSARERAHQIRMSHSIDALYAMLEPWASQQSASPAQQAAVPSRTSAMVAPIKAPEKRLPAVPAVPARKGVEDPIAATPLPAPLLGPKVSQDAALIPSLRLEDLPALTTQVEQCLAAETGQHCNVWGDVKERKKQLSASSPRDVIPMSWSAYVKAYARGDFDLSNPPYPRSAPLVNRALPRSPRMDAAQWSTTSLSTTISSPGASSLLASKESFHSLRSNWDSPSAKPSNSSRDALTAPTSPSQPSLRSRISTPRLGAGLHKKRSRDASHEPMPIDAEDEDESIRLQAEELVAVGGFGDLHAPRPSWEENRSRCAQLYATLFPDPMSRLSSIVSQLKDQLGVSQASVQLLVGDESVVIASTDADEHSSQWLYDDDSNTPRPGSHSKCRVFSRDCSLDAHVILQRDGRAVMLSDTSQDWRFDCRADYSPGLCFYAGRSLFAAGSGLPIGTISVTGEEARVLDDGEMKCLEEAAREVQRELEWLRRNETQRRLKDMEASLTLWLKERSRAPFNNTLADRRRMGGSMQIKTRGILGQETAALNSALDTIFATLQADFVFVARVGSKPLSCQIIAQRQIGGQNSVKIKPNPAMHLCALAAHKSGLYFEDDADQVRQLLGHETPVYASAASVGCGLKEGGKAYRGTEGWVLTVVARLQGRKLGMESRLYLTRFARPIASLLLALEEQEEFAERESRTSSQADLSSPTKILSPITKSPGTPRFTSSHAEHSATLNKRSTMTLLSNSNSLSRKKLPPLASPPPMSPLPLLPDERAIMRTRGLSVYSTT